MDYEVNFRGNTIHMAWKSVPNNKAYSLVIEKCDDVDQFGFDNCYQIFSKIVKDATQIVQTSEHFSDCTTYQLKVRSMITQQKSKVIKIASKSIFIYFLNPYLF